MSIKKKISNYLIPHKPVVYKDLEKELNSRSLASNRKKVPKERAYTWQKEASQLASKKAANARYKSVIRELGKSTIQAGAKKTGLTSLINKGHKKIEDFGNKGIPPMTQPTIINYKKTNKRRKRKV